MKIHLTKILGLLISLLHVVLSTQCTDSKTDIQDLKTQSILLTDRTEASLRLGTFDTLKILSGTGDYTVLSMNPEIVNAVLKQNIIELYGKREGKAIVTLFDLKSENKLTLTVHVLDRIPDLLLSTRNVKITSGEQALIKIIQGSGSYSLSNGTDADSDSIAKISLEENKIIKVLALKPGKRTSTIIDRKTKISAEIQVLVEQKTAEISAAEDSINIFEQESRIIDITSGSGSYSANPDNRKIAQAEIINGNKLKITGLKQGKTAVFVADNRTKSSLRIVVVVNPFDGITPFTANGIRYSYLTPNEVEVMALSKGEKYKGNLIIPDSVSNPNRKGNKLAVTQIAPKAFYECDELKSLMMPETITKIGSEAFWQCRNLSSLKLPRHLHTIEKNAFSYSGISELSIPSVTKSIGIPFCLECPLLEIMVEKGNKHYSSEDGILFGIEEDEYADTPGQMVKVLIAVPRMKKLTEYAIPAGTVYVKPYAFSGQHYLEKLITGDCTELQNSSFVNCERLHTLELGENLEYIGENGFTNDLQIQKIHCYGPPAELDNHAFPQEVYTNAHIYINSVYNDNYQYAARWSYFKHYHTF